MKPQVDSFFNSKLKNHQVEAPPSAWDRIDASLTPKKKPLVWLKFAAGLLLITIAGFILYTSYNQPVQQLATIEPIPVPEVTAEDSETTLPETERVSEPVKEPDPTPVLKQTPLISSADKNQLKKTNVENHSIEEPVALTVSTEILIAETKIDYPVELNTVSIEPEMNSAEPENTTIVISAVEANAKYLNQQFVADATPENKKSSKIRNLFEKAQDLDPIGEFRQFKNEVLALNFRNEKKGERNR